MEAYKQEFRFNGICSIKRSTNLFGKFKNRGDCIPVIMPAGDCN